MTTQLRHFLRDDDLSPEQQARVLDLAAYLKTVPYDEKPLLGPLTVAVLFDKPTLRTQASFASGIAELGGFPMIIDGSLAKIGVRESVSDTARVLVRLGRVVVEEVGEEALHDPVAPHDLFGALGARGRQDELASAAALQQALGAQTFEHLADRGTRHPEGFGDPGRDRRGRLGRLIHPDR